MSKIKKIDETLLVANLPKKTFSNFREPFIKLPNLVENQLSSFKKLIEEDLGIILKELNLQKLNVSELELWNYLKDTKWINSTDLALADMVSDIFNLDIELFIKSRNKNDND